MTHSHHDDPVTQDQILVIKLGAFGDFIQALGPMAAIRRHHPTAHITLLTTEPFITLARESGYADTIWTDTRPKWTQPKKLCALAQRLRGGKFTRVYDLQNNDRTAGYLWLFGLNRARHPQWVGAAFGASHRNTSKDRSAGHAFYGHVQTLALAGIDDVAVDDLRWVKGDIAHFGLPHPYVLLVPGSAPGRPEKRWPAQAYGGLARHLYARGYTPVIIGTMQEAALGQIIQRACPQAVDLCGRTSLMDLVALARAAAAAIGNDTGPLHLIAPTGCPTIVLFSQFSNPSRHAPLGARLRTIQPETLGHYSAEDLIKTLSPRDFRHQGTPASGTGENGPARNPSG